MVCSQSASADKKTLMIWDWLQILFGLVLLVGGGEALVRGASGIAQLARVTPAVVGLTIVAAGTSMPEFVVSVQASIGGESRHRRWECYRIQHLQHRSDAECRTRKRRSHD
jgi:Ca2+/Na+ antiporter